MSFFMRLPGFSVLDPLRLWQTMQVENFLTAYSPPGWPFLDLEKAHRSHSKSKMRFMDS